MLEESDKTRLARFFGKLQTSQKGTNWHEAALDEADYTVPVDVHAATTNELDLPHPLTSGSAQKLMHAFRAGTALSRLSAVSICREAISRLEKEPNVLRISPPSKASPLLIVGDLHGSLSDLYTLLEACGWPGAKGQRYVFNGDFVDRGEHGCELLLILLALKVTHPDHVFLIRGNHEDLTTSSVYGFKDETLQKFSVSVFNVFINVFKALPLCAQVGGAGGIFIVHAGLPRNSSVTLKDIDAIKRNSYVTLFKEHTTTNDVHDEIVEDLTWSDPADTPGCSWNEERGAGVLFGPDVARDFLQRTRLSTIVRSHEAMQDGCEWVSLGEGQAIWTVFSASNYSGSDNKGAVLEFYALDHQPKVHRYRSSAPLGVAEVDRQNLGKLEHYIAQRRPGLSQGFKKVDKTNSGRVSLGDWANVMRSTLDMNIDWSQIRPTLSGCEVSRAQPGMPPTIQYTSFLESYILGNLQDDADQAFSLLQLYDSFPMLKAVFQSWDSDHNCEVDQEEFCQAIDIMNKQLKPHQQIQPQEIFPLIDIDNSGSIDLNEFCESYRLVSQNMKKQQRRRKSK